jgi:hypothetical protein
MGDLYSIASGQSLEELLLSLAERCVQAECQEARLMLTH